MKTAILLVCLPLALTNRVWYDHNFKIPKKTRGTGRTSTARPGAATRALWYFEGVDYDRMPSNLKRKNNDCYAHFGWCTQSQAFMNPVCGWDHYQRYLYDYYSPCEIELQNCKYRQQQKKPFKGDDMRNDNIYYNGEGYNCIHYVRMGGDPVENYFRMDARRNEDDKETSFDSLPYRELL